MEELKLNDSATAQRTRAQNIKLPILLLVNVMLLNACTINIHLAARHIPAETNNSLETAENILQMYTTSGGIEKNPLTNGESFELKVQASVEAFIHCYYRQSGGEILRLFPNQYSKHSLVAANESLRIPDSAKFQLVASLGEQPETIFCLAAHENLEPKLPFSLGTPGFSAIPVGHFDELYVMYRELTASPLIGKVITVNVN